MNLGIVADEISRDFRQAVRVGKSLEIDRYEIRFLKSGRAPLCDLSELNEIERIADGENVKITNFSPGLFKNAVTETEFKREVFEVFPLAAEMAHRWGLKHLTVFSFQKPGTTDLNFYPNRETPEYVFDWFAEASEIAATENLSLLIEPEPICWADTGTTAIEIIERTKTKNLGLNYDPCNAAWTLNDSPADEFASVAPFVANLHVKDQMKWSDCDNYPIYTVPGEGIVNWQAAFSALARQGYTGNMSLEPHMDGTTDATARCKMAAETLWRSALVASQSRGPTETS